MCSRFFRQAVDWPEYEAAVGLIPPEHVDPPEATYNAAPMSVQPVIRPRIGGGTEMVPMLWGLVPSWWTKPLSEKKFASFQADAATAHEKPVFRGAFRYRRCLVPVSGFYVWTGARGEKQAWAVALKNGGWFCLAGLWDCAMIDGSEFDSFAVLTTQPNDLMAGLSTRMPVILAPETYMWWLDPARDTSGLFAPFPAGDMRAWRIGPDIGNVRNDFAGLIAAI